MSHPLPPNPFLGEWPPTEAAEAETPAQRTARQTRELEAARISARIDEDIRQQRLQLKKEKDVVRVLLLGQAESGKSTTLKNFLMRYATEAWQRERSGWRAVVQLNVVRSIITIIAAIQAEMNGETAPLSDDSDDEDEEDDAEEDEDENVSREGSHAHEAGEKHDTTNGHGAPKNGTTSAATRTHRISVRPPTASSSTTTSSTTANTKMTGRKKIKNKSRITPTSSGGSTATTSEPIRFTEHHQLLMIRLATLRSVEGDLMRRLGAGSEPLQPILSAATPATPFDPHPSVAATRRLQMEFSVRSWTDVLSGVTSGGSNSGHGEDSGVGLNGSGNVGGMLPPNTGLESATLTIAECREDMKALWDDKNVRETLRKRRLRLPDSAGFFLNELDRVATRDYQVTDDDIVRARLRTVGIQEHRVRFSRGPWDSSKSSSGSSSKRDRSSDSSSSSAQGWEWRIYDVGGCRTSRQAWLPFFENANCIIFLCPVSVFDERLEEDPRVNRLEDSILLWKSICSSRLLAKTQLVLFLNKCDLLKRKLKRGVKVNRYLTSYKDRNEVFPVVKYLQGKFKEIQKSLSPEPRTSYIFPTTVTDTQATARTLETVRDGLLRANLSTSQLI